MKHSIKQFLLIYLLVSITVISSLMTFGNYFLDNHAIKTNFDNQLLQASDFFSAFLTSHSQPVYLKELQKNLDHLSDNSRPISSKSTSLIFPKKDPDFYKLQFRVWNKKENRTLLETNNFPTEMSKTPLIGYKTVNTEIHSWRILATHVLNQPNLMIIVAEPYDLRSQLVDQLTWNNLLMLLWGYPLFALLIWVSIDRGLSSLRRLTGAITHRRATNLELVDVTHAPVEVKPLVDALNQLFLRLQEAFERNKRFSSDAAHELRTPLAALKTQAQVLLKVSNDEERKIGLKNLVLGVDRCTHIVQQLLTLSRLDPEKGLQDIQYFNLSALTAEMIAQLVPSALEKNIDIELIETKKSGDIHMLGNETFIAILIRNLVDNAIRYTPPEGEIKVYIEKHKKQVRIKVLDSGPGIPKELRARVFERFYRVLGTKAAGSGLGLAIVQQIAGLHHGEVKLDTPPGGHGLEVRITFTGEVHQKLCSLNKK